MIGTCDKAIIHLIADNVVDSIPNSSPGVDRRGIIYHFTAGNPPIAGATGFCVVIDAYIGETRKRILVDGGWNSQLTLYNMKIMGIDPTTIESVVLSHGHPDHFSGLFDIIRAIGHTVPLYVHPDAFYPRVIERENSFSSDVFNRELTIENLEAAGARVVLVKSPVPLMSGVLFSGEIERVVEFEREVPKGRFAIRDYVLQPDDILDDTAMILNVKGKGLIVILACGHAGAINTSKYAQKLTGEDHVYAVMGGLHVGHLGATSVRMVKTFEELKAMGVKKVVPVHCSGMVGRTIAAQMMPEEYLGIGAATSLHF